VLPMCPVRSVTYVSGRSSPKLRRDRVQGKAYLKTGSGRAFAKKHF
jgi:hypothetical protein